MARRRFFARNRWLWAGLGLVGGLLLAGFWPQAPLHAIATDRSESFAMATGAMDDNVEAVYFLDFLTGNLRAAALSKRTGKFNAFFQYNVNVDMGVDPSKNPRYMMVTGFADLVRQTGGRVTPSRSVLYVAEVTTGKVAAFMVPWSNAAHMSGQPQTGALVLLDITRFRTAAAPAAGAQPNN
jgi:hypothetical protein